MWFKYHIWDSDVSLRAHNMVVEMVCPCYHWNSLLQECILLTTGITFRYCPRTIVCNFEFANMTLVACSEFKSLDLFVWRSSPFRKFKNMRADHESSWSCLQIANNCPRTIVSGQCRAFWMMPTFQHENIADKIKIADVSLHTFTSLRNSVQDPCILWFPVLS